MVRGKRQAIDSAFVKANASLDSLQEKEITDDVADYAQELNENSEYKIKPTTITPQDKSTSTVTEAIRMLHKTPAFAGVVLQCVLS